MIIKRLAFETVLARHLGSLGIDHAPVTAGPDFDALDRQGRLYRLALFARQATGDELLGLRIGRKVPLNAYGALGHAMVDAATPRQALQTTVRHMRIFQSYPPDAAALSNGREHVVLAYRHPVRLPGFANFVPDLFFASSLHTLRQLGADLEGARLELDYAPQDQQAYAQEIGLPVAFRCRRNRLLLPAGPANAPLPGKFFSQSGAHARLAENVLLNITSAEGLQGRVLEILKVSRPDAARAPLVAAALGVSERSLRRRLAQAGLSFADLLASLRADLARNYLRDMPVRDVAELLGYHDPSTFRRAFRRWTGQTPQDFRR